MKACRILSIVFLTLAPALWLGVVPGVAQAETPAALEIPRPPEHYRLGFSALQPKSEDYVRIQRNRMFDQQSPLFRQLQFEGFLQYLLSGRAADPYVLRVPDASTP